MAKRLLDRYEVQQEIGRGGMGVVHSGVDRHTGQRVAIKCLHADLADSAMVDRFRREGETLRRLNHPNIVQLLDVAHSDEQHYLVMELVEGGSLREKLDQTPRLDIQHVLSLSIEIVDALTRAHHLKIIHRDIKPANVLLAADGTPRLADFGLARVEGADLSVPGTIVGTIKYLSPELLQGKDVSPSTDIWAFGVMLFEMVVGSPPFKSDRDFAKLAGSILNDAVPDIEALRPDVPAPLADLIYRMLAKDPAERIPSFRLVGVELEFLMQGRTGDSAFVRKPKPLPDLSDAKGPFENLPAQTTPFLGRASEIESLRQLLESSPDRLITILAQGGMGKTRLALEVATRVRHHFAQGVAFVPLTRIPSAHDLAQAIAEELHLALASQDDPKVQLLEYFRNNEMLLVLDNFEHVLEGRSLVHELLESAPRVKILATSRERLGLFSEVAYNLPSMKTAEWNSIEEALTYSSAQLFVQGAKRAQASFALQPADIHGLARICGLVEGLPLGILLAAGWASVLSVDEIATEIEKSIRFLETDLRDVPDRHRSIRSVVESTWSRLEPPERELFAKLSVFRSTFSRSAAQAVAGASLLELAKLTSKSLLTRDADTGRYHIHEVLCQFAQEQLELSRDASRQAREAHAAHFATFMEERWVHLKDHRVRTALREIKDDMDNVRAAWRTWLEARNGVQLRKFFESLWMSHETWGWIRSAIDLFHEAAAVLEAGMRESDSLESVRAYARAEEAWFTSLLGKPDVGISMARGSLAVLQRLGEDLYLPTSAVNINAIFLNQLEEVEASSQLMLQHGQRTGDRWVEGFGLIWHSYVAMSSGRFKEAQASAENGLAIFDQLRNDFGVSVGAGIVLGAAHMAQGHLPQARQAYERGLEAARSLDSVRVIQCAYDSLGTIALLEGRVDDAHDYFLKSLKITYESGQSREQLGSLRDIATIYKLRGDLERAVELLAVVLQHPAREQNSLSRQESLKIEAERLRVEIETILAGPRYEAAWARGRALELGAVVADLVQGDRDAEDDDTRNHRSGINLSS